MKQNIIDQKAKLIKKGYKLECNAVDEIDQLVELKINIDKKVEIKVGKEKLKSKKEECSIIVVQNFTVFIYDNGEFQIPWGDVDVELLISLMEK